MKSVKILFALSLLTACANEADEPILAPTLTTSTVANVTATSAMSGGSITSDGGGSVSARGVVWSSSPSPIIDLATKSNDGSGNGTFVSSMTGLTVATKYYVRAYATNSAGTAYGNEQSFTTASIEPTVTTSSVTSITASTATSGGNVVSDGGATVTVRGIVWSINPNPTVALTSKTADGSGTGIFVSLMSGLSASTKYYIRAYATNSVGSSYGAEQSFTTSVAEPTKVFFYAVVATPTDSESITLKNNSGTSQNLSGWTIGDLNNPVAYNIPAGTILLQGETRTFPRTTFGFAINDSGETLYLKDAAGALIDSWSN